MTTMPPTTPATPSGTPAAARFGRTGRAVASSAAGSAAAAVGSLLGLGFRTVASARSAKAIHPRGAVYRGRLHRHGIEPPTGVAWLDQPGQDDVLVRFSRGVGLPAPLPDVLGLAVRVLPEGEEPHDLLLSSAGRAPVLRHVLLPRRDARRSGYTSIVPFVTPAGSLLVGAFPDADGVTLQAALRGGPWLTFGRLELEAWPSTDVVDIDIDFDPMLHGIPGLEMPTALARLREPSYRASRLPRRRRVPDASAGR